MANKELIAFANFVSQLLGWIYVLAWSLSFYPQPWLNWKRKSTHGLAIDFPTCNVLGFVSYTVSNAAFLYSSVVRRQYAYRHPVSPEPTVRFNDLAFAAHGALLCVITYSQFFPAIWGFKVGATQRASRAVLGIFWGSVLGVVAIVLIVKFGGNDGGYDERGWAWLDVVYALGYVKLICTVIKYIPQVYVNFKRKSTVGWSINQILLDLIGGVLSLAQLTIDSSLQGDWSGITGNPAKFGLSNVSLIFDIIFITQHYVLYSSTGGKFEAEEGEEWESEHRPLIHTDD